MAAFPSLCLAVRLDLKQSPPPVLSGGWGGSGGARESETHRTEQPDVSHAYGSFDPHTILKPSPVVLYRFVLFCLKSSRPR